MSPLMPAMIEKIPASPDDWRPTVQRVLKAYGEERWNRERIAARVRKLVDWNNSHGGGLKIWCAEFGCYQRTIDPEARYRYLRDVREAFESHGIGWAYWSYNETLTVMTPSVSRSDQPAPNRRTGACSKCSWGVGDEKGREKVNSAASG